MEMKYISIMENSNGNVWHRYREQNKQTTDWGEVRAEGMCVSIHYVCLLYAIGYQSCSSPNFVCLSTTTTGRQFSIEIGKWPKLNCSSQCCPRCEFRHNTLITTTTGGGNPRRLVTIEANVLNGLLITVTGRRQGRC